MPLKTEALEEPNLILTPVIDIMFLLLIFFMVGTQFVDEERQIPISLPTASDTQSLTSLPDPATVNVTADGQVYLQGDPVAVPDLERRLADRRRNDHVYAAIYGPGLEPTVDGVAYPDLPGFAQRMMVADQATRPGDPWGRLAPIAERGRDVAAPVAGLLTVPLEVRRTPLNPFTARSADRARVPTLRGDDEEEP